MSTPAAEIMTGITGFVKLSGDKAEKYSEVELLYWLKEYTTLMYLWEFRTDTIVKYTHASFLMSRYPTGTDPSLRWYQKLTFQRFPTTLHHRRLYHDGEILQVILDLSSALAFLHSKNIIHRDIKPANIALTSEHRAVLLDFSHAYRKIFPIDMYDKAVVTYYYRAPDVFRYAIDSTLVYTDAVDIWALGMTLLEVLYRVPFSLWLTDRIANGETIHGIPSGITDGEAILDYVFTSEALTKQLIDDFIASKRPRLIHQTFIIELIKKMLIFDADDRIKASQIYDSMLTYLKTNGIAHHVPVNGVFNGNINQPRAAAIQPNELKYDVDLYGKCITYGQEISDKYKTYGDINTLRVVVQKMLFDQFITETNYRDVIAALMIISETVLFDRTIELSEYKYKNETLNTDQIRHMIYGVMCRYDQKMFGVFSIFDYAE